MFKRLINLNKKFKEIIFTMINLPKKYIKNL
jgi:hypothetical protein